MTRTSVVVALVLGSVFAAPAQAQGWSDFGSAFKLFPCADGWSGCRVDGNIVQPDMQSDSQGMPTPAHLRVGWFDLQATSNFSPFAGLSDYTGELAWGSAGGDMDAASMEEPEPVVVDDAAVEAEMDDEGRAAVAAAEAANEDSRRAQEEAAAAAAAADQARKEREEAKRREEARRREAEENERRRKEAEAAAAAASDAAEKERLRKEAEEAARKAAEAEAARKAAEEESRRKAEEERKRQEEAKRKAEEEAKKRAEAEANRKAEEEARKRAEAEAQRKAEEEARKRAEAEAKRKAEEEAAKKAAAEAAADDGSADAAAVAPPPPAGGSCGLDELVQLEPKAMLGKLDEGTIGACEQTLASAAKMTDKGKVSRILMVNAFSKGDKAGWERLVKRHLDEIDQSDPDLCYKYALHLSKKGAGRASGVIRWSDVALENRTRWTGDTYTSRVYSLYKLRAAAAQSLWMSAEKAHASAPSDDTGAKVEKYRSMTKVMSREWYEYAKQAGKDTTKALQLCMSAAGTKDYCEAG